MTSRQRPERESDAPLHNSAANSTADAGSYGQSPMTDEALQAGLACLKRFYERDHPGRTIVFGPRPESTQPKDEHGRD